MKKIIFKGSSVALITPFKKNFDVDFKALEKLIEFQIKNGTNAIISCGTTGESSTLSEEEYIKIIDFTVKKVKKRIPVIAGSGSNNTKHALERSLKAENVGVDGLLIVTPYYNKTSQNGIVKHYSFIANKVKIPIITYNVPSRTGLNIEPETYKELSYHKNIVATKEASENISNLAKTISLCGNDLRIYCGNDNQIIPFLSLGSLGVISVFANIFPKECNDIIKKYQNKKQKESKKMFLFLLKKINAVFCDVNPIPIKFIMRHLKMISCEKCRLPLTTLSKKNKKNVLKILFANE